MTDIIWHYTTGEAMRSILQDGRIKPTAVHIAKNERAITWFSTEPFWEPTVTKGLRQPDGTIKDLDMRAMLAFGTQLFRIGVESSVARMTWPELKRRSKMPARIARVLVQTCQDLGGHPARWRGTLEVVSREQWSKIEIFNTDGDEWIPFLVRIGDEWKKPDDATQEMATEISASPLVAAHV